MSGFLAIQLANESRSLAALLFGGLRVPAAAKLVEVGL